MAWTAKRYATSALFVDTGAHQLGPLAAPDGSWTDEAAAAGMALAEALTDGGPSDDDDSLDLEEVLNAGLSLSSLGLEDDPDGGGL